MLITGEKLGDFHGLAAETHSDIVDAMRNMRRETQTLLDPIISGETPCSSDDAQEIIETLEQVDDFLAAAMQDMDDVVRGINRYHGAIARIEYANRHDTNGGE